MPPRSNRGGVPPRSIRRSASAVDSRTGVFVTAYLVGTRTGLVYYTSPSASRRSGRRLCCFIVKTSIIVYPIIYTCLLKYIEDLKTEGIIMIVRNLRQTCNTAFLDTINRSYKYTCLHSKAVLSAALCGVARTERDNKFNLRRCLVFGGNKNLPRCGVPCTPLLPCGKRELTAQALRKFGKWYKSLGDISGFVG